MAGAFTTFSPSDFNQFDKGWDASQNRLNQFTQQRAGNLLANGDTTGAVNALARAGMLNQAENALALGNKREAHDRTREVGAAYGEDPKRAASLAAAGGDLQTAMQIETHLANMDGEARKRFKESNEELARMMTWVAGVPPEQREQRRAAIVQSLQSSFPDPNAPEARAVVQRAQTMPLDDGTLKAEASKVIGMDKLLGSYSTRNEGDYAVTTRTNPFGPPEEISRRLIPPTRDDRRADATLALREQSHREQQVRESAVTPSKVMGPIYEKLANGEPLTAGEEAAMKYYKMDPLTAGALSDTGGGAEDGGEEYARPGAARAPAAPARPAQPGTARIQAAPRQPNQRRAGAVYQTPRGPMKWTGTGWLPQ